MGIKAQFIGRFCFILILVIFGLERTKESKEQETKLIENYSKFHSWVLHELHLEAIIGDCQCLSVDNIKTNATNIIKYSGVLQFFLGLGILLAIPGFGFVAAFYFLLETLLYFNPLLSKTKDEFTQLNYLAIQNIALVGGAFMMCCGFCYNKIENSQKDKK